MKNVKKPKQSGEKPDEIYETEIMGGDNMEGDNMQENITDVPERREKNTMEASGKTSGKLEADLKRSRKREKFHFRLLMGCIVLLVLISIGVGYFLGTPKQEKKEIITTAALEKVLDVSELSTFEAVYNGIARVMNGKDDTKTDYYVSYEATVKAGIDFSGLKVNVDNDVKKITITLPRVTLSEPNVDIGSLDYIFVNSKANTATVSEQAYKKCIEDAKEESRAEKKIYELATQNAHNIVEALVKPFVEQLDAEYGIEIKSSLE